jgi:predicted ABC-type ATPase
MENKKPVLIVIAGPNGSGKTTITGRIMSNTWSNGCVYINPDEIAKNEFGGWDSPEAFIKAAQKATQLREDVLIKRQNLAFETVLSTSEKIDFLQKAKGTGYFIRLFFICTDDPEINAARITQRYKLGGHIVPIDKIVNRYYKSVANCVRAVEIVDRAYIYDNSVNGAEPQLLFRAKNGKIEKIYKVLNAWASEIAELLDRSPNMVDLSNSNQSASSMDVTGNDIGIKRFGV